MEESRPKIALWFRYGPAEHAQLFHAIPEIVAKLAETCEVHFYGLRTERPIPELITKNAIVHSLPFSVDRTSDTDKLLKTLLWVLALPFVGLHARFKGIQAVYIDETVPLTALLARIFFGRKVAFTVADFFTEIFFASGFKRIIGNALYAIDLWTWKRLPLIFTRAKSTRSFLGNHGVPENVVHPVYDPCDMELYHPTDKAAAKAKWGYGPDEVVLVHHGILHPNKGNDRIIRALANVRHEAPELRYLLVGDGVEMDRLKTFTEKLDLQDIVQFTGWLETLEEVNEALNAGDMGLVMRVGNPGDDFHMTGALVHSMACGLPVIAARLAGVSEVIHEGENGFLFDPNNMTEFKTKLLELVRDPEMRKRYGKALLDSARVLFDMDNVVDATVKPLLALVQS